MGEILEKSGKYEEKISVFKTITLNTVRLCLAASFLFLYPLCK